MPLPTRLLTLTAALLASGCVSAPFAPEGVRTDLA